MTFDHLKYLITRSNSLLDIEWSIFDLVEWKLIYKEWGLEDRNKYYSDSEEKYEYPQYLGISDYLWFRYYKYNNKVYFKDYEWFIVLTWSDISSFKSIWVIQNSSCKWIYRYNCYWKDNTRVFYNWNVILGADPKYFQILLND